MAPNQTVHILENVRNAFVTKYPWFAMAIYRIRPVNSKTVPTAGVDKSWRLYYNEEFLLKLTPKEAVGIMMHELLHLLWEHPRRAQVVGADKIGLHKIWNIAADMSINCIKDLKGYLPKDAIYPSTFDLEDGQIVEWYYEKLMNDPKFQGCPRCSQEGEQNSSSDSGSDSGEGENNGAEASDKDSSGQNQNGSGKGDKKGSPKKGSPCDSCVAAHAGEEGSGVCNRPASWELPDDGQGPSEIERGAIKRDIAQKIREDSKSRGDIPGWMSRWAEDILRPPTVPWQALLKGATQAAVAWAQGAVDYTYSKPNRRQQGVYVIPAMRAPIPEIAVVLDTSGSVSDSNLGEFIAEVSGALKSIQSIGIKVISCDAAAAKAKQVFSKRQLKDALVGGGGTDMRIGVQQALQLRPKPVVIIVMKDGFTPWPEHQPPHTKVIAVITPDGTIDGIPSWIRIIRIDSKKLAA